MVETLCQDKEVWFFTPQLTFLGYVVSAKDIQAEQSKVKAIQTSVNPKQSQRWEVFMV